jgi:hypothetical protein
VACCKRARHAECVEQTAADDCCARHEQTRQPGSIVASAVPATATFSFAVLPPAMASGHNELTIAVSFEQHLLSRLHGPPGLFSPPLRV